MPNYLRVAFGLSIVAFSIGGPAWYYNYSYHCFRNFHVVEEGTLYRSGQLNLAGLKRLIHDYGIKTVVSLRDGEKSNDINEERYLMSETALNFVRIPPRAWWASDGSIPAEKSLAEFRDVMDNPANFPVLVHCFAGIHRTGGMCAIYRMDHDGWTNVQALQEMRNLGYTIEHMDVLPYLENYRPHVSATAGKPSFALPASRLECHAP